MAKFFNKNTRPTSIKRITHTKKVNTFNAEMVNEENNIVKTNNDMTTYEKIQQANSILSTEAISQPKVKRVKKDKGLIERTESSAIVLTEDNKELLND